MSNLMPRSLHRGGLLAICVAGLVATTGYAADDEIIVTGSRIANKDYDSISPISTVSSDVIESTGRTNIEQVLNTLPQVVPGLSATSNNPSDGTATVDLRGIGPSRTLVLINGRRVNPSTNEGVVDLNNIPTRLIERVEVVTGGASAVYGSDALAGVVNFVLKDDYEGFEVGYQTGISSESDGYENQVDMLLGGNFANGRGNATVFASWYDREEITQAERSYTAVDFQGGSGTGIAGRLDNSPLNPFPDEDNYAFDPDGTARPFINDLPESNDGIGDRYNFAPPNLLLTPQTRVQLGGFAKFDITDQIQAYTELTFVDSRNDSQLAPTPATNILVDLDSPFLSSSASALLADRPEPDSPGIFRRRMVEVGARGLENSSTLSQINVGLRGDLGFRNWTYDTYYSYGRTDFDNFTKNDVSHSRFEAGIAGCPAEYTQFVPSCVPVNPFGAGNITPEMADFIRLNFADNTVFKRDLVNASINGDLFEMPAGMAAFALGVEWRKDSSTYTPDGSKQSGDIEGFNAQQPIAGDFDVLEFFGELAVPVVENLELELGIRFSDYSTVGNVNALKAGLNWSPTDQFRARAMYQRASRAPSLFESLQNGDQDFPFYVDPCAGTTPQGEPAYDPDPPSAEVIAFCAEQGIPSIAGFTQLNDQIESFNYGSSTLGEETSDTYTVGIVFRPGFAENLQISLDYWNITVDDYINDLNGGAQGIIDACFAAGDLDSPACFYEGIGLPLIYRLDSGELNVNIPLVNSSELETSGVDFQMDYDLPVGDSTLDLNLVVSWLDEYVLDNVDYADSTGWYNINIGSLPEWRATARVGYDIGPVDLTWTIEYIDGMQNQGNLPEFQDGGYLKISSRVYHDLSARWAVNENWELTGGIRNLLDKEPPIFDNNIDQNTDPSQYDMVGRFYFAGVRTKF
ncbi:MAG: TonB-dependent receptor [Gammaproteobacteria bacterium]|nr:TonB-dependent receptor [Gammaproteobacteria bacterium]